MGDTLYCTQARVYTSAGETDWSPSVLSDDPALAWVISEYRLSGDNYTQAAIAYLVHMRHEEPGSMAGGDVAEVKRLISDATPQGVKDLAAALIAQGDVKAGPYTVAVSSNGGGQRSGYIKDVGVLSDSGQYVAGITFELILSGPAVFRATGTDTLTGTTSSGPLSFVWDATGNGPVTSRMKVAGLARQTLTYISANGARQSGITFGLRNPFFDPVEITSPPVTFEAQHDFVPTLQTTAQHLNDAGVPLDTVTVGLPVDGSAWPTDGAGNPLTLITRHTAYPAGLVPFAQTPTIPSVAALGTEILTWTGTGTQTTSGSIARPAPGFVSWVDEIRVADQFPDMAELIPADRRSDFMIPAETTSVRHELTHSSRVREYNVARGGRAFDSITLSGFPADHGDFAGSGGWGADVKTGTATVYRSDTPFTTATVPAGTEVLTTITIPARNGAYNIGYSAADIINPTKDGYYVVVYSFAGDDRVAPFTSAANDVLEQFYVPPATTAWIDLISTATQSAEAGSGQMSDTALVLGTAVPAGSTLTWFRCVATEPSMAGCGEGEPTYSTPVNGSGAFIHPTESTPDVTTFPPGFMTVYVGWAPELRDANGVLLLREPWGTESQTTKVSAIPPAMSSQASATAGPGDVVSDTVELTGPTRSDWTIRWEACWLTNGACPDGGAFAVGDPQPIDPAVTSYVSPDWTVQVPADTAPGAHLTLGWAPVILDALGAEVTREAWGASGQTTSVDYPLPSIVSTATDAALLGQTTQDRLVLTGPVLAGSLLSWQGCYLLEGDTQCRPEATPVAPGPVQADGLVGVVLPALAVGETLELVGPQHTLTAGGLRPDVALRFSWMPTVTSPDGFALVTEAAAVPDQTTIVQFPPVTAVTSAYASSPDGPWYGDGLGDRVTTTGDVFAGDTVTVNLFAWATGSAPVCEGEPLAQKVVELDASTSTYDTGLIYTTPADRTDLTYGFQETTHSRGTDVVSECGLAAETVTPRVNPNGSGAGAAGLAQTGMRNLGLLWFAATCFAFGVPMVAHSRAKKREAAA